MSGSPRSPRPPDGLSARARRLWRQIHEEWEIPSDARALLEVVCRSLTRLEDIEAIVAEDGLVVRTSKGQASRAHPLLPALDKERTAVYRGLRDLGLDDEGATKLSKLSTASAIEMARKRWSRASTAP